MNLRRSIKRSYSLIFVLSFTILASGFNSSSTVQVNENNQVRLEQFDLVTDISGWVLLDKHLFWTSDAGQTWSEIGPSILTDASVEDVEFTSPNMGWMLLTTITPGGGALFQLTQTTDGGNTWATRALSLFESDEIASFMERAEMGWFDAQTGWVSVKQASGSNFSIGTLFTTSDGGDTWSRSSLPVADKIVFSNPQTGWAVGGPTGDQVFKTQDVGITWQNVRPDGISSDAQSTAYPPVSSDGQGLLVMTNLGLENNLSIYGLETSSSNWPLFDQIALDVQPGIIGLSILNPQNFVATIPGTASIVRMADGELDVLANADGLSTSIVELDMVSLDGGWAKSVDSNCITASSPTDQTASVTCSSTTRLLQTADGGITWQTVFLPDVQLGVSSLSVSGNDNVTTMSTVSSLGATNVFIGQGFDKCEIPSISQMQTWWNSSPYKTVNLYIGGSSRACSNNALTASYLEQLNQQGWQFIPTWVGPQAPCTGYISRMSSDVTTAYNQGIDQANLAVERLAELGLTYPDKTGSVVYYDIENYGTETACRDAVNSFMNGWVSQIHTRGNQAGVYGSTLCNTGLSDFLTITNVPDVIWPARWYHNMGEGFYDPTATVWDLGSCIPNTVWANQQRIRQYEGDHNETWGGLTLGIDSNVLDGVVALPFNNDVTFEDVPFSHPFWRHIEGFYNSGITVGCSQSPKLYCPDSPVTRGEMAVFLLRAMHGSSYVPNPSPTGMFADVPYVVPAFTPWIEQFYNEGITVGCNQSPLMYCPQNHVTRGEMAVFILRAIHGDTYQPNPSPTGMFADLPYPGIISFTPWIEQFYNDGITVGCNQSPLMYCPQNYVTRGEMAVFIDRAFGIPLP